MAQSGNGEQSDLEIDDCITRNEVCDLAWSVGTLEGGKIWMK